MKNKIKIIVVGQIPPPFHGSNVMALNMVECLKKNSVINAYFIDKKFSRTISQIGKFNFNKLIRIFFLVFEIIYAIIKFKPSFCIFFLAVGKPAFFLDTIYLKIFKLFNIPYVLRFGGKGYSLLEKKGAFWKFLVKDALSNALGGIIVGNKMRYDVNAYISNSRLILVPNCADQPLLSNEIKNNKKIQVLFLSNLIPSKGVMEVIKAARIVLKSKKVYFVIAGANSSKEFRNEIEDYLIKHEMKEFFYFPGPVSGKIKAEILQKSDIFVFPTYYEFETFGIVNVEAMSYGLPVISSCEGAISEVVIDNKSGFLIDPISPELLSKKILLLAEDKELREKFGRYGNFLFNQKYTKEAHKNYLENAINKFYKFTKTI